MAKVIRHVQCCVVFHNLCITDEIPNDWIIYEQQSIELERDVGVNESNRTITDGKTRRLQLLIDIIHYIYCTYTNKYCIYMLLTGITRSTSSREIPASSILCRASIR